jgi:hypothetical protein
MNGDANIEMDATKEFDIGGDLIEHELERAASESPLVADLVRKAEKRTKQVRFIPS